MTPERGGGGRLREGAARAQLVCLRPGIFRIVRWNSASVATVSWRVLRGLCPAEVAGR